MSEDAIRDVREVVDAVYRSDSRQVLATLIRLLGDFDAAEEALHEAFTVAVEQWAREGRSGQSTSVACLDRSLQGHRRHAKAHAAGCVPGRTGKANGICHHQHRSGAAG